MVKNFQRRRYQTYGTNQKRKKKGLRCCGERETIENILPRGGSLASREKSYTAASTQQVRSREKVPDNFFTFKSEKRSKKKERSELGNTKLLRKMSSNEGGEGAAKAEEKKLKYMCSTTMRKQRQKLIGSNFDDGLQRFYGPPVKTMQ